MPVIKSMDESIETSGQSLDKNPSGAHALPVSSMLVHSVLQDQVQTQESDITGSLSQPATQATGKPVYIMTCDYNHTAC